MLVQNSIKPISRYMFSQYVSPVCCNIFCATKENFLLAWLYFMQDINATIPPSDLTIHVKKYRKSGTMRQPDNLLEKLSKLSCQVSKFQLKFNTLYCTSPPLVICIISSQILQLRIYQGVTQINRFQCRIFNQHPIAPTLLHSYCIFRIVELSMH